MDTDFGLRFFGALFAIMNPLTILPLFLAMTSGLSAAQQRVTGMAVAGYAAILAVVISLGGQQILDFFSIDVDDFRVAGGLVLSMIALGMLNGAPAAGPAPGETEAGPDDNAFYPLTFPMTVGPGTITTLLVFRTEATSTAERFTFWIVLVAMLAILAVALFFAGAIGARLSNKLRVIMSKLMGMILLAIAVSMLAAGLKALLPGLG